MVGVGDFRELSYNLVQSRGVDIAFAVLFNKTCIILVLSPIRLHCVHMGTVIKMENLVIERETLISFLLFNLKV